ncbi:hypothetical protein AXG93_4080s1080 [Marchantia polymorpha subsp. ruderalis]|uniref:ZC3H15/TMA46 family C-terminal domain-containing protein n=1 Tax=Marchantia polymorpha subsp. ruderalis TaxID=1480154 RepID=A0A176VUY9_MARPO|nr:hypothetical protein AXG93_4080s1080 [Marchantia polymorpha subsp. ruderalis]
MGAMAEEGKAVLTPSQFNLWKQRKDAEAAAKAAEAARKREEDIAAGRVRMNGRELYKHEPWDLEWSVHWSFEVATLDGYKLDQLC